MSETHETPAERRLREMARNAQWQAGYYKRDASGTHSFAADSYAKDAAVFDAGREALALLRKLANEVTGMLGLAEHAMREAAGHTNVAVLIQRRDEARALLARCGEDA